MAALSNSSLNQNWFFRYKLYHLPFWFVYHYLWWIVTLGNPVKVFHTIVLLPFALKYSFYVIFQALAVYVNLYFLIPRYLEKSRFTAYISFLLLTILGATFCIVGGYYFSAYASGRTIADLFGSTVCFNTFFSNALPSTVASVTLGMSIKLTKNWIQTRQRQQLLEKEKLETELNFIKNQFNTHFLFNTLDFVYHNINLNPSVAKEAVIHLSKIMRFAIDSHEQGRLIPLKKELSHAETLLRIYELRKNGMILPTIHYTEKIAELSLIPLVILTLIENMLKHGYFSSKEETSCIKLLIEQGSLCICTNNPVYESSATKIPSGYGLTNIQKRLLFEYGPNVDFKYGITNNGNFQLRISIPLGQLH